MDEQRNIYLKTTTIEQALEQLYQAVSPEELLGREVIPTHEAAGRVTAEPVRARYSSPTFHSAAMDGVAVRAESTFGAREDSPVMLRKNRDFVEINTGNILPPDMDSVIMVEKINQEDENTISVEEPAYPWQHVRRIGEDIVATELLLPQNHLLSAYDIGALLSGGIWEVMVREKVLIHFIPTGDEVLDFISRPEPRPGQVIESNSQVLTSMARSWDCGYSRTAPVPDDHLILGREVQKALDSNAHIVVIGAGSSAGTKDYTRKIIQDKGIVLVHGLKAMPGKPTLLGVADNNKILVGAPGYPVSSVVCFEQIIRPLVFWLSGRHPGEPQTVKAILTRKVPSKLGMEEFLRVSLGRVGDRFVATPLPRGAGMMTSLTRAQGLVRIPADLEGVREDREIGVQLLRGKEEILQVLVCVGSHDNTLDLLANELMGVSPPIRMASTHVGSMGGITAASRGFTHMAGMHLFDPAREDYNFPFLERYAPDLEYRLINLAVRHQGIIVPPGNPKKIHSLTDLTREEVQFVNRQKGAGTRILLDYHLERSSISPDQVRGYSKEEYTHMGVAVNVLSGTADCGLGIQAAAAALDLDFVPLARERYDLLIPAVFVNDPKVQKVLRLLGSKDFKTRIEGLGGYETHLTGLEMQPGQGLTRM